MAGKTVPFFDYPKLWTSQREKLIEIIDTTASSGGFIMQAAVAEFEENLARFVGSPFAVGVGNATDAMEIFLEAIGLASGDEVIISSHTMLATASAVKMAGGVPIPVDIGSDNLIDPDAIESAITSRTVGIMPTQLNGRVCDMSRICAIAEKYGLFVVEDSAQALGARYKGTSAGTFGLASCISFFPAKVLGCLGDAGAVLVRDQHLYESVYQIHDHGRAHSDGEVKRWGRNSRLDNLQAAILRSKLDEYDTVISRRRDLAALYEERLSSLDELTLPPAPDSDVDRFDVFQNYELAAARRDELRAWLADSGVGTLIQWGGMAIHHFTHLGFQQECPKTDRFFKECIMLPMNIFISDDDAHYVCDQIFEFYRS